MCVTQPEYKIRPLSLETPLCLLLSSHQQPLLERFLNRAAEGFQNLFTAVEDHFELCLAKCRTSSQVSVIMLVYVALACLWHSRPDSL